MRRCFCLLLVLLCFAQFLARRSVAADDANATTYKRPVVIHFNGMINPQREQYLARKVATAKRQGADLVIVQIDSPGGFVESSINIAELLGQIDWAHTVAYIPREAISGAAFISLGCDEIVMASTARLGDAGPIIVGPDAAFRHAPAKIRSYLARVIRDLCETKGRSPALGEAMVDENLVVYEMRNRDTQEIKLLSKHDLEEQKDPRQWEEIAEVTETRQGLFFTVNGRRAFELGFTEGVADSRSALLERFQVDRPPVDLRPTSVDVTVSWLNWWVISILLIGVGLIALLVELSAPGISVGGFISALCFVLFFWSRFLGGTAGWLEVILFLCGIAFLAIEIFVTPGFGVPGILGLLLIVTSMIFAGQDFWIPDNYRQLRVTTTGLFTVVGGGACFALGAFIVTRYFGSLPIFNHLVLAPPKPQEVAPAQVDAKGAVILTPADAPYQVGDWGVAISPLRPAGKIEIGDQLLDVTTDGSYVESGKQVKILKIQGNHIVVREVSQV